MFPPSSPRLLCCVLVVALAAATPRSTADIGDPQIRTDHPWYPGELAVSTFGRLFATQAEQYERATGQKADTDEHRALASWFWRNTHYAHGEEGAEDLWGTGFTAGDLRGREYWTGLFAHGFGLCGTTHSQWTAEMQYLLGHTRGRGVGTAGHNSFEVWLTGGEYGTGRWALLDHDLSTVIFDPAGRRLLSIPEVKANWQSLVRRDFLPGKQHGWLVCGLHPGDGGVYKEYQTAEYLAGYAGPPPIVHLRRDETFRRYFEPGLESGKEFVFWGRNSNNGGIPGLERNHTWVNQPEKMHGSTKGAGSQTGQARFANAVFTYQPDFTSDRYREGIVEESDGHVIFEFNSPYIIAATPPNAKPWGIYDSGCTGGLVINGRANCDVAVSVDRGRTWSQAQRFRDGLDLTDAVKGHRQYRLRLGVGAKALVASDLIIRTVCQANAAILPRLKDGGTSVSFAASQQAVVSVGPNKPQAETHVVEGAFSSPTVTLKVASPRGERITSVYAAAQFASGNPPDSEVKYRIDCSHDNGATWQPVVKDWTLERRGDDPPDFWSQSFCYGSTVVNATTSNVLLRFSNTGKRAILRAEAHATYRTAGSDATKVTYQWTDDAGDRSATHVFSSSSNSPWIVPTGKGVQTRWVEFAAVKE